MVEYSKVRVNTKDGSTRYRYFETIANGTKKRISFDEYNKRQKSMKEGGGKITYKVELDSNLESNSKKSEPLFSVYKYIDGVKDVRVTDPEPLKMIQADVEAKAQDEDEVEAKAGSVTQFPAFSADENFYILYNKKKFYIYYCPKIYIYYGPQIPPKINNQYIASLIYTTPDCNLVNKIISTYDYFYMVRVEPTTEGYTLSNNKVFKLSRLEPIMQPVFTHDFDDFQKKISECLKLNKKLNNDLIRQIIDDDMIYPCNDDMRKNLKLNNLTQKFIKIIENPDGTIQLVKKEHTLSTTDREEKEEGIQRAKREFVKMKRREEALGSERSEGIELRKIGDSIIRRIDELLDISRKRYLDIYTESPELRSLISKRPLNEQAELKQRLAVNKEYVDHKRVEEEYNKRQKMRVGRGVNGGKKSKKVVKV